MDTQYNALIEREKMKMKSNLLMTTMTYLLNQISLTPH